MPPSEQLALYHTLKTTNRAPAMRRSRARGATIHRCLFAADVSCEILSSVYGHDAFLKEFSWHNRRLSTFLAVDA